MTTEQLKESAVSPSLMEQAFQTHRESLKLVGDAARGSRAKQDTLAFTAWLRHDIVATKEVFDEMCKAHLTSEELADSYSASIRSNVKAVLFSTKPEVKAIVEQYDRGQYIVGLSAAAAKARGTADRAAVKAAAKAAEQASKAPETTPAEVTATQAVPVPPLQQIEALLENLTVADLRIVAEMVQAKLAAKSKKTA